MVEHGKKWLIYSSVGPKAKVSAWMHPEIEADFAICRYHEKSPHIPFARYQHFNQSVKFPNFFAMLSLWPEIVNYDYYLWADDDIEINTADVRLFMQKVEQQSFDLAQPSLTSDSSVSWRHLVNKPGKIAEPTIFVEVQFFAMSKRLIQEALPYFQSGYTGYGMDVVMSRLVMRRAFKAAVVHGIQMRHPPRPASETVHNIEGIRNINQDILQSVMRKLGKYPSIFHLEYLSSKVKRVDRVTLLLTAPFYFARWGALALMRVFQVRSS